MGEWEHIKVGDVMHELGDPPPVVNREDLIEDLAQLVVKSNFKRSLYVVDDEGRLVGIVMLHKLLKHLLHGRYDNMPMTGFRARYIIDTLFSTVASDIMKRDVVYLKKDDSVEKAIELMVREGIKDIPVVDDDMKVIGYVDIPTIIKFILEHQI